MAQVRIHIDRDDEGYRVSTSSPDFAQWQPAARMLRCGTSHRYPLPPLSEQASWRNPDSAVLWREADDTSIYQLSDVVLGDPGDGDLDRFGEYLFMTLLGPSWGQIEQLDSKSGHDLQLTVSAPALAAQSLPWEMMSFDGAPLIAHARRHSVCRLIEPEAPVGIREFQLPLRVLFVVGKSDPALRPGAEYLGILRSLGDSSHVAGQGGNGYAGNGQAGNGALSPILNVRSLAEATAEKLAAAVVAFKPHVVHIVAHGLMNGSEASIRLAKDVPGGASPGAAADLCSADRLLGVLRGGNVGKVELPPLVLLSACNTGTQPAEANARSFAAALVHGGVAAAIGMAGEVASSACRLFTKAFYRGLASQMPLDQAVAWGQSAARLHYEKHKRSVEWARPALFRAVGAEFKFTVDAGQVALIEAAARQRGTPTLMCDRSGALRAYQQFIEANDPGRPSILAFEQASDGADLLIGETMTLRYQLGKTLLLSELSWHAILDGFLPCFIRSSRAVRPPNNMALFVLSLVETMDALRVSFGVEPRRESQCQRTVFGLLNQQWVSHDPARPAEFAVALGNVKRGLALQTGAGIEGVDPAIFEAPIRSDVQTFCEDIRKKCPAVRGALILIDDMDHYAGFYEHILHLVNEFGLGVAAAPAPLVLTYAPRRAVGSGTELERLLKNRAGTLAKRTQLARLEPFADDLEGRAAYLQYLLKLQLVPIRGAGEPGRKLLSDALDTIHEVVQGVPSFLDLVRFQAGMAKGLKVLASVDDEAIFQQMARESHE